MNKNRESLRRGLLIEQKKENCLHELETPTIVQIKKPIKEMRKVSCRSKTHRAVNEDNCMRAVVLQRKYLRALVTFHSLCSVRVKCEPFG